MARYFYCPVSQTLALPENQMEYASYGICVLQIKDGTAIPSDVVPDVSLDRDFVFTLAYWCTFKQLSPIHLLDVIMDALH